MRGGNQGLDFNRQEALKGVCMGTQGTSAVVHVEAVRVPGGAPQARSCARGSRLDVHGHALRGRSGRRMRGQLVPGKLCSRHQASLLPGYEGEHCLRFRVRVGLSPPGQPPARTQGGTLCQVQREAQQPAGHRRALQPPKGQPPARRRGALCEVQVWLGMPIVTVTDRQG